MFLKPFRVKSNNVIKGSDRKKLRAAVTKQYPTCEPDIDSIVPPKEEMRVMKVHAHTGRNLNVYTSGPNPIFFEDDGTLVPTVYLLWRHPRLMDLVFTTHDDVFDKLAAGADLMLPGVIVDRSRPPGKYRLGEFKKGAWCAVRLESNLAPVAVGTTALDNEDMFLSAMRGKGVIVGHMYKDQLWAAGDKSAPPRLGPPPFLTPGAAGDGDVCDVSSSGEDEEVGEEEDDIEDGESSASKEGDENCVADKLCNMNLSDDKDLDKNEEHESAQSAQTSLSEVNDNISDKERMDNLLYQCCLLALKNLVGKNDIPLLTSTFCGKHLQEACKELAPDARVDVKKSSYKKYTVFFDDLQQKGILKVREESKGVLKITEICRSHPEIKNVESLPKPSKTAADAAKRQTVVTDMYCVNAATLDFFKNAAQVTGHSVAKGTPLTLAQVRSLVAHYVKRFDRTCAEDRGKIVMDDVLGPLIKEAEGVRLGYDQVLAKLTARMSPGFCIQLPGCEPVMKKGHLEPISVAVGQRSGNKKVTLVTNLELYGVDVHEFAHKCQVGVAASTAISPVGQHKPGQMEVLIQGNQVAYVGRLLSEDYNVNLRHVSGLDQAAKKKKKKK